MSRRRDTQKRPWTARWMLAPLAGMALVGSAMVPPAGADDDVAPDGPGADGSDDRSIATEASGESYNVTLITGDVVHWQVAPTGEASATVEAAEGDGAEVAYQFIQSGDDAYVIPDDVASLVGHALDRELFNVPHLVEQGYHDAAVDQVPILMTGTTGKAPTTAPGVTIERTLSSADAVAGAVDHDEAAAFGERLATAASAPDADNGQLAASGLAGVERISLDQQVEVSLEDSVPQTGAPDAWDAGFDGTGTTIAVLDTGIDETHADIGDKVVAAQNFSDSDTATDRHGHGTHVAATAAGSGNASDGLRTGVAPGAQLINAKVMGDTGSGAISDIIAGMEWAAAEQDADIISMSLGGGATDGTDPMSEAVNTLTAEHDALFVIAAGNSGPSEQSVESPGTADAALTVGAVDKSSELASFSSRGPRVGDFAIKPDITAPGVDIVAARADGSSMGSPVDDLYTMASGTSMATPHVAGAAAILTQQNPDWNPATLKGTLVGSATASGDYTVYEQGGGELDVTSAIDTDVVATPGTVNLGYFQYPHDDTEPVSETVTYTNHGDDAVTLDVAAAFADEEGNPAADGMVSVSPESLTLEAGTAADVEVTVDPSLGAVSLYSGSIVATDADGEQVAGTPAGFYKEGEMYELTVEGTQRDGRSAARGSSLDVVDVADTAAFLETSIQFVDGVASVRVPPGTYSVMGVITTLDENNQFYEAQSMVGEPEIEITEDTTLTWDAREATEISVDTGDDAALEGHSMAYHRGASQQGSYTHSWTGGDWPYSAVQTDAASTGLFEFYSQWEMVNASTDPARHYDLIFPEPDAIPAEMDYEVGQNDVATIDTAYHSDVEDHEYGWTRAKWRPYEFVSFSFVRRVDVPQERVEYVSGGDTRWLKRVRAEAPFTAGIAEPITYYDGGDELEQSWFASPNTPTVNEGNEYSDASLPVREDDLLSLSIYEWGDAHRGDQMHYGSRDTGVDTSAFRLYQDGELVTEDDRAFGDYEVAPGESRLRLEVDAARQADWWQTSTETHTAWEFDSTTTSGETTLPMLQIGYDLGVDELNRAPHPRDGRGPFTVGLDVRHLRGVDGAEIQGARAWLSYDDGQNWRPRPVRDTGDGSFEVIVDRRGGPGHASIKVEAWDAAGNTVEQEVIRAYAIEDRGGNGR